MKDKADNFWHSQSGMGTVEVVIIVAVLVGIALIFRDAIINFVTELMSSVFANDTILNDINSANIRQDNVIN
jgi:hypothetical protein